MRRLFLSLLAGLLLASLPGCGGGCGEEPTDSGGSSDSAPTGGGGGSGGSGEVSMGSRFDAAKAGEQARPSAQAGEAQARPGGPPGVSKLMKVGLADLPGKLKALSPKRRALVFETAADCADCETARPVLESLAAEHGESYDFHEVDVTGSPAQKAVVLPLFMIYQGPTQTSRRAGLPFARQQTPDGSPEKDSVYRRRLRRWFQDALTQGNLNFAGR